MDNKTIIMNTEEVNDVYLKDTIKEVALALDERGYNAVNQLVGYLISGDLGYISSYKEARNRISKIDRLLILETILKEYLK